MKKKFLIGILICLVKTTSFAQTYPVVWTTPNNDVVVNADNSVTKTSSSLLADAGIVSMNTLYASENGYLEFTVANLTSAYAVGLCRINNDPTLLVSNFSLRVYNNTLWLFIKGDPTTSLGTVVVGDVLRISRDGNTAKTFKNGVQLSSTTFTTSHQIYATDVNRVDASLYMGTMPPIVTSFRPALFIKPTIQVPTRLNNDGSISLAVESHYNPVTYSWSSGETTSSISGKARGSYLVTVTDGIGRVFTRTYYLGHAIEWTNLSLMSVNSNNTLTKGTSPNYEGASSVNILPPVTNGFVEFVIQEPPGAMMIGLSKIDRTTHYGTLDYCWYLNANGLLWVYESGSGAGAYGSYTIGDVLRVDRDGNKVRYMINGVVKRQVTVNINSRLVADVSVATDGATVPYVVSSFEKTIRLRPTLTFPNASTNTGGGIALNVEGAYSPSTIAWSSSETTSSITNKARGIYSVTVTDAGSRTLTKSYRLGYPVQWTDVREFTMNSDNTMTRSDATLAWNSGAISSNVLAPSTDGWVEFSYAQAPTINIFMVGLARYNNTAGYSTMDYAFYLNNSTGEVYIFESNVSLGSFGMLAYDQTYTLAREGSNIKYYINGVVVKTTVTNATYQLHADVSGYQGTTPIVSSSFGKTPTTYYTIANGVWTSPSVWSLTEGGPAATTTPGSSDIANIKGYSITVDTGITSGNINITATNGTTALIIDGAPASLTVKGEVKLKGENNTETARALVVQNDGKINVVNP